MRRFGALSTVDDVVAQDVEALGPDGCQDLHGEVMIVADSIEAGEAECFHFVAVGRTPASSLVLASPDMIDAARALLTHGSSETTKYYYVLGQSVATSRRHAELVKRLRRSLPGSKRPASPSARQMSQE
jgi:hypothetical protein